MTPANSKPRSSRKSISKELLVSVFRRDSWLCHYCGAPVIFSPALKLMERFVRESGFSAPLDYYHPNWPRGKAPLLHHLGVEIDHVQAHRGGGSDEESNLVTICHKCNLRKRDLHATEFTRRFPRRLIKGKHGEPEHWDGLSAIFVILLERFPSVGSAADRDWLKYLKLPARGSGRQI
jgi:5-methylcytosine-specific restriction endonuclease McrA